MRFIALGDLVRVVGNVIGYRCRVVGFNPDRQVILESEDSRLGPGTRYVTDCENVVPWDDVVTKLGRLADGCA